MILTTKELSSESVYQQSFVEKNGVFSNSGMKMETNCLMAYKAGSGRIAHSSGGSGTDHCPCWVREASRGAGWKLVHCKGQLVDAGICV